MKRDDVDYRFYLCTDRFLMTADTVEESVERACAGGVSVVQLREKTLSSRDLLDTACRVKEVCERYNVPLIVNDRLDIALACGAAGVHVGQDDVPARIARKLMGPDAIIGVSASNRAEAQQAIDDGADYIGLGALFATRTKDDARVVSKADRGWAIAHAPIPVVGIGGVNELTIPGLKREGMDNFAIISAVVAQDDIEKAARRLGALIRDDGKSMRGCIDRASR